MIELGYDQMQWIEPLFAGWEETAIWSCLQGVMGRAWADALPAPAAARIENGDFVFFGGDAARGAELVRPMPHDGVRPEPLFVPQDERWSALIERVHDGRCKRVTRYALAKESGGFDRAQLQSLLARLPQDCVLQLFDRDCYTQSFGGDWSKDFCAQFASWEDYAARGLGVAVLQDGVLIAGASSYTVYRGGLEIEIAVHPDWRRRGLATVCAARLILECLDRGLYPSWDAANPESRDLAVKLGYRFTHAYPTYIVTPPA